MTEQLHAELWATIGRHREGGKNDAAIADALRKYAVFQRGAFGDYAPEYVSSALSRVDALGIGGDHA